MEIVALLSGVVAVFGAAWFWVGTLMARTEHDYWKGALDDEEEDHAEDVETAAETIRERDDRIESLVAEVGRLQEEIQRLDANVAEHVSTIANQAVRLMEAGRACAKRGGTLEGLEKLFEEKEAHIDKITTDAAQSGADLAWYRVLAGCTRNFPEVHSSLMGTRYEIVNLNEDPTLIKVREMIAKFGEGVAALPWDDFTRELASLPVRRRPLPSTRQRMKAKRRTGARKARS